MSIASEISRLSSNISDSLDAVAAKGVTVPSDSNSDDLPGLIALIEQSSGGDSGGTIYQDTDGYLHLSEDNKNVISIVDTLDTAGGTIRTITGSVISVDGNNQILTVDDMATRAKPSGRIVITANQLVSYAFFSCKNITAAYIPNIASSYGSGIFSECTSLKTFVAPNLTNLHNSFFLNSTALEAVDFLGSNNMQAINDQVFRGCTVFTKLIIRCNTSIVPLRNLNNFMNTPFYSGGTGGTIYIPKVFYDHLGDGTSSDYKADTNWSALDAYGTITWAQIEGSIYETQYADGTPIT